MPAVTVAGAHSQTVTLTFDTKANAILAQQLANAITAGVQGGTIIPAVDTNGPPPPLHPGRTGEFVQTLNGLTIMPSGYKAFVDTAQESVVFGSGGNGESVLSSTGDLKFFATGGSGTVVTGGGDNLIVVPSTDRGAWSINTGNGNDVIMAVGGGNDTIDAGGGRNAITLGSGNDILQSTGDDTVNAGAGHETIGVIGTHNDLIRGNSSELFFVAGSGSATVFGGTGSDTFFGGKGTAEVHGGTGGDNLLIAGAGNATLFGGGNGDQLFGGLGNDTFVASTGTATITAGSGTNLFVFTDGQAGGTASIQGFTSGSGRIDLQGYGKNEVANALKSQTVAGGTDTITLSDHTTISFASVNSLTASDFITSGSAAGNAGGSGNPGNIGGNDGDDGQKGHGHGSQGMSDMDDHGQQIRNSIIGHS